MKHQTFKVDRRAVLPRPSDNSRGRCTRYPFDQMAVGENFLIKGKRMRDRVHRAMLGYANRHRGYQFKIRPARKFPADPNSQVIPNRWRCFRVAADER